MTFSVASLGMIPLPSDDPFSDRLTWTFAEEMIPTGHRVGRYVASKILRMRPRREPSQDGRDLQQAEEVPIYPTTSWWVPALPALPAMLTTHQAS